MTTSAILALAGLLVAAEAKAVDVCVSVSQEKIAAIQEAAARYNDREGTGLTANQWAKLMIRVAVVNEAGMAKEAEIKVEAERAIKDFEEEKRRLSNAAGNARQQADEGW